MTYPNIDLLVSGHDFQLTCWSARYGGAIWAACLPTGEMIETLQDAVANEDDELLNVSDHLRSKAWLPISTASTMSHALAELEQRLCAIPHPHLDRDSPWCSAVVGTMADLKYAERIPGRRLVDTLQSFSPNLPTAGSAESTRYEVTRGGQKANRLMTEAEVLGFLDAAGCPEGSPEREAVLAGAELHIDGASMTFARSAANPTDTVRQPETSSPGLNA